MGKLREKIINETRAYIKDKPEPIPPYDYNIVYPVSVYEAIKKDMTDGAVTLDNEIASIYRLIAEKQDLIQSKTPGQLMTWSSTDGLINSTPIESTIKPDERNRTANPVTERAIGEALDGKASVGDLLLHTSNTDIHSTEEQRNKWDNMTPLDVFQEHVNDASKHLQEGDREKWDAKAEASDLEDHLADLNNPHEVDAHQVGAYDMQEIDEMFESVRESFFNYKNINYDERNNTAKLEDYKPENWNPNYVLGFKDDLPEPSDPSLKYFALKPVTDYTSDESQNCYIYVKLPGQEWDQVGVQEMTMGDMVIRYPDTVMCVWIQGRFVSLFSTSSSVVTPGGGGGSGGSGGGGGGGVSPAPEDEAAWLWRPKIDPDGTLGWTKSYEQNPPDPMNIKGEPGYTPRKGIDYNDGAPGIGIPAGGSINDLIVKTTNEDYDTEWLDFEEFLRRFIQGGGVIPGAVNRWEDIEGKPEIYQEGGNSADDWMSQKAITEADQKLQDQIQDIKDELGIGDDNTGLRQDLEEHIKDFTNPHQVTPGLIGAVTQTDFLEHTQNINNPHQVTAAQVGLGNVDDTSDLEKPVSHLTQLELDKLRERLDDLGEIIVGDGIITSVTWDSSTCTLLFDYRNGEQLEVEIPILKIMKTIYYDNETKELVILLPDSSEHRISIKDLITIYNGYTSKNIKTELLTSGYIKAELLPESITGEEIAPDIRFLGTPTAPTWPADDAADHIATDKFVHDVVIDRLDSYEETRPLSANMGRVLNSTKTSVEDVLQILSDTGTGRVIDNLESEDRFAALSANMGRELFYTKAPTVHASPSSSRYGSGTAEMYGHARASTVDPLMDGEAELGIDDGSYARATHRHPSDLTRAPAIFGVTDKLEGEPKTVAPPPESEDDRIPNTKWVVDRFNESHVPFDALTLVTLVDEEFASTELYKGSD